MSDNLVTLVLDAAKRHAGNPAVDALVERLDRTRQFEKAIRRQPSDILAGYRRGADGDDGYGMMHSIDASLLKETLDGISHLREVAVVAECLGDVLTALGEHIPY